MPIYAYKCSDCGHEQDVLQKINDAPLTVCPECGRPSLAKQVTAAGFQLKGTGWYVTDFRNKDAGGKASKTGDAASDSGKTEAVKSENGSSDSGKTDSGKADSGKPDSAKTDGKTDSGGRKSGDATPAPTNPSSGASSGGPAGSASRG